jgi:charged multivesicular body protein 2A
MGNEAIKIDPKEQMKANKRLMDRAVRKIERERVKIEGQEKKHLKDI